MKTILSLVILCTISQILCNSYAPVIAIVSLPDPPNQEEILVTNVMGHYVRWIESAGVLAIAIHSWMSDKELDDVFTKINGVLFQGGDRDLHLEGEFEIFSERIFRKVIDLKKTKGIHIPLWAICQGQELINMILAKTHDILTNFDANNIATPLIFDLKTVYRSRMYSFFSGEDIDNLGKKNTTSHYHNLGTSQKLFDKYKLGEFFEVTAYGEGRDKGNLSIESYEAKEYPIYGVLYHPEKMPFDHYEGRVNPMTPEAIKTCLNLSLFFISEARKNLNRFSAEDKKKYDFIDIYQSKWIFNSANNRVTQYFRPKKQLKNSK